MRKTQLWNVPSKAATATLLLIGLLIIFELIAHTSDLLDADKIPQQIPPRITRTMAVDVMDHRALRRSCRPGNGGKRVLVTGAAGFIGFHVSKALTAKGEGVIGLDNFNDYYPVSLKIARKDELRASTGVHIVVGNLTDMELLTSILKECKITHVVHLAAQAGEEYKWQIKPWS